MAELIAKTALGTLLPITEGAMTLTEIEPGHITSIAPFRGKAEAVTSVLHTAHGCAWPAPNRCTGKAGARALWAGLNHALLIGPAPDPALAGLAALTDQSDAWATARLEGPEAQAEAVLARLIPLDLRRAHFKRGHTARSTIGHMSAVITRTGPAAFDLMVFRSMARTLVHELQTAMKGVAARTPQEPR